MPPGGEGTVCRQVACSLEAARNDCAEDARFVCGTPIAPWQIETPEGSVDMGVP